MIHTFTNYDDDSSLYRDNTFKFYISTFVAELTWTTLYTVRFVKFLYIRISVSGYAETIWAILIFFLNLHKENSHMVQHLVLSLYIIIILKFLTPLHFFCKIESGGSYNLKNNIQLNIFSSFFKAVIKTNVCFFQILYLPHGVR